MKDKKSKPKKSKDHSVMFRLLGHLRRKLKKDKPEVVMGVQVQTLEEYLRDNENV